MKMRPPATPIINIDPYFSVWAEESVLNNTVHWTGKPNTIRGRVFVDGEEYHFLGDKGGKPDMEIENISVDAHSTVITYKNNAIRLVAHFTSPTLVEDLYYASRPVAYCKVSYESLDGLAHEVKVKFSVSEELVLNKRGEGRAYSQPVKVEGVSAQRMGKGEQRVLHRSGDDIRIDWGYFYLGVKGEAALGNEVYRDMYAVYATAELKSEALFLFAYDDIDSIQYFGKNLKAYWKKDGKTIEEAIAEAAKDYDALLARCDEFSNKLWDEATACGGEKYAELLQLALRQVMAAHKLVVDEEGNNLYISKECYSNGCAATVDVTYPSAPMFLKYNPELLKGMLRPVMRYAASEEWDYDFAPHDVGQYPLLNGQVYGVRRKPDGTVEKNYNMQMPVEECGNMIILFAAICDADNSADFVRPYMDTVREWSRYLIKYGLDPENQLCTDDFAGHLAHNVNLSIKAVMGIAGYARILERLGETAEADKMMATAREYAASIMERAKNSDGSYRLAFDRPETFSLKYNSVWDKLWGTGLFTEEFYKGEIARYKKELLPYGVPLDSRERYTKSDWLVWAACLAEDKEDFEILTASLWSAYNTMRTFVPMTDWYYCDTSHMKGFRHRTVQGGLFIKLMF
ncbi:MAG: DUF4965 domain-containing protein [Clostridia bacterium]|nr:DUF4965 domain-containing protein [Clostridia bacterium]